MKLIDFATYLVAIAMYSVAAPVFAGSLLFRYQSKPLKILFGGLVLILVVDIIMYLSDYQNKNSFLYIFSVVDVATATAMFAALTNHDSARKIILFAGITVVALIALDALYWSGLTNNGYSNALGKILIIVFCVFYLTELMQNEEIIRLRAEPLLWISAGLLAYNLVGMFDVFSKQIVSYSQNLYVQFYMLWSIVTIFMNGCFLFAFWRSKK